MADQVSFMYADKQGKEEDDQKLLKFIGKSNFFDLATKAMNDPDRVSVVELESAMRMWGRVNKFFYEDYQKTEASTKKLINKMGALANSRPTAAKPSARFMQIMTKMGAMNGYVQAVGEKVAKDHKRKEREFMRHSSNADVRVHVLVNMELVLTKQAAEVEKKTEKVNEYITQLKSEIDVLKVNNDLLSEELHKLREERSQYENELEQTVKSHAREVEKSKQESERATQSIERLKNHISSDCDKVHATKLINHFTELQDVITKMDVKVDEIDNFNVEMRNVNSDSRFKYIEQQIEGIKNIQASIGVKMNRYLELRKALKFKQGEKADTACVLFAMKNARDDIGAATEKVFEFMNSLQGLDLETVTQKRSSVHSLLDKQQKKIETLKQEKGGAQ